MATPVSSGVVTRRYSSQPAPIEPPKDFDLHLLRFVGDVVAPLQLPLLPGSTLRGALLNALRHKYCLIPNYSSCGTCPVTPDCVVAFLTATHDLSAERGADVPRPYVLRPPTDGVRHYLAGDRFEFGLVTIGRALECFPDILLGLDEMGSAGLGAGGARRGRFRLQEVWAVQPLLGEQRRIFRRGEQVPLLSALPIVERDVAREADRLASEGASTHLVVHLRTPLRLTDGSRLVLPGLLSFRVFLQRLLERITQLSTRYGSPLHVDHSQLLARSEGITLDASVRWLEVERYSSRQGRRLPMGGLLGSFQLRGSLTEFLPWLIWGQWLHVGKYSVLGHGWYQLSA